MEYKRHMLRVIFLGFALISVGLALQRFKIGEDLLAGVWAVSAVSWGVLACLVGTVLLPKKKEK